MMDIKPVSFKHEYETVFILAPDLPENGHQKAVDKFVQMIKDNDGKIHNIERWGVRRLAYPIRRKTSGYYVYIEFEGKPEFVAELEQNYRYDDAVMRYLTVKLDKHSLAFNVKRREQGFGLRKDAKTGN
ncbi:MAG: 30S ribosomal protein S6 [Bacteroidia bacterium]|nr:30S ribosomal protein S6 [Bacteroidia bacterium]